MGMVQKRTQENIYILNIVYIKKLVVNFTKFLYVNDLNPKPSLSSSVSSVPPW